MGKMLANLCHFEDFGTVKGIFSIYYIEKY